MLADLAGIIAIAPNGITSDSNSQVSLYEVLFPIMWDWVFSVRVGKSHFVSEGSFKFPIHEGHLSSSYSYRLKRIVLVDDVNADDPPLMTHCYGHTGGS